MDFKITRLYDDSWAVEDGGVRFFILAGSRKALVVDTGFGNVDVVAAARTVTDLPLVLLNTHADRDHVGGNAAFDWAYMHPSEGIVYHNIAGSSGKTVPVWDGEIIDLGWRQLEVVHIPGHTPGSISILDKTNRALIGGDPIQEGGRIFMFGMHRDMEAYIAGLRHLMEREAEFDVIYPSHAKLCVEKSVIPKLIDGAVSVLAGQVEGKDEDMFGNTITTYDVGVDVFLCPKA
ncbi:MAG: MBL fold metallo-hydrolase [Firmicutes bacterium]|nr:MBL fold metallo-hydrolase [Bacillota bacterium]